MKKGVGFSLIIILFFSLGFASAVAIEDSLHLNILVTNSSDDIVTGTFDFDFNISTSSDCANVIYTNSTDLTTDSRGLVSYYLENVNLNFSEQYWLCYYRNGTLINASKIAKAPYTFSSTWFAGANSTNSTQFVASNGILNLLESWIYGTSFTDTWNSLFRNYFDQQLNTTSNVKFNTMNTSMIFETGDNVGIGTAIPNATLHINMSSSKEAIRLSGKMFYSGGGSSEDGVSILNFFSSVGNRQIIFVDSSRFNNSGYPGIRMLLGSTVAMIDAITPSGLNRKNLELNDALTINASGNVGIGTDNPSQRLEVNGTIRANSANFSGTIYINNGTDVSTLGNDSWNESYAKTKFAPNTTLGIQALYNATASMIGNQSFNSNFRNYFNQQLNTTNNAQFENLTLGEKITFALGEIIDNIVNGWIRITGNLNVTGNLTVGGNRICNNTACFTLQDLNATGTGGANITDYYREYETDWINRTDWTNVYLGSSTTLNANSNVTHNLNAPLSNLTVRVLLSSDGTDANSFEVVGSVSQGTYNWDARQIDNNKIGIYTGGAGFLTMVAGVIDTDAYFYKIKVTQVIALNSTPLFGGTPAGAISAFNLDACPTGWVPYTSTYDTGWIANNDWTNQKLGDTVGGNVTHNFGVNLSELEVKVFASTDGTDAASFDLGNGADFPGADAGECGITIHQVNTNKIAVQTGIAGLNYNTLGTGAVIRLDTEAYYYKVVVSKIVRTSTGSVVCQKTTEDTMDSNTIWATSGNDVVLNNASKSLNVLGNWSNNVSFNKIYQVMSDGFVIVMGGDAVQYYIKVYMDETSPPTTMRGYLKVIDQYGVSSTITIPIHKSEYFNVSISFGSPGSNAKIWYMPFGSGTVG